ncbi:MAG: hypothetical protein AABX00_00690 [Nanoarchaeota archaeon]
MSPPGYPTQIGDVTLPPGLWLDDAQLTLVRRYSGSGKRVLDVIMENYPDCPQYIDTIKEEGVLVHRYNIYPQGGLARVQPGEGITVNGTIVRADSGIPIDPKATGNFFASIKTKPIGASSETLVDMIHRGFSRLKKVINEDGKGTWK